LAPPVKKMPSPCVQFLVTGLVYAQTRPVTRCSLLTQLKDAVVHK